MAQKSKQDDAQMYCQEQQATPSLEHRASHTIRGPSRRAILMGGLAAGVMFAGGALFVGHNLFQQTSSAGDSKDRHLTFSTSWQGLDFTWLPDSTQLACASDQGLFVVDMKGGQRIWKQQTWPHYDYKYTQAVRWSADGTRLVYLTDTALLVQDVKTGQNLWSYQDHNLAVLTAMLSPDGTYLALAQSPASRTFSDGIMQIWNVQEGRLSVQYARQHNRQANLSSLKWSPDNVHLASTSQDGSVQLWHAATGNLLWAYNNQATSGPREAISWSPDGSSLAFIAGGMLGIWDALSGRVRFQAAANVGYPLKDDRSEKYIAWSPDGTRIAFEAQGSGQPVIEVWSVQSSRHLFTCQHVSGQLTNITWSPDGRYIAAGNTIIGFGELADGDNGDRSVIQFWDAGNGNALFTYSAPKRPDHLSWSPDSRSLAIITPRTYGILPDKTCLSLCRYGYVDYALEVFQID